MDALPHQAEGWAFFLDFDGTLVDIAAVPEAVVVPEDLPAVLTALAAKAGGALALVSGRSVETLDRLLRPVRLPAAGVHGAEIRLPDSAFVTPVAPEVIEIARRAMTELAARHPGLILEDKGVAIALHFRNAPAEASTVLDVAERAAAETGRAMVVQQGKMVVELRPSNADKGRALATLMTQRPFAGRRPIAIGDDLTDEPMLAAARALGGVAVRVGSSMPDSAASLHLADPAAVRGWLAALA
jgi:trehalose 6-phosphate phosphatase